MNNDLIKIISDLSAKGLSVTFDTNYHNRVLIILMHNELRVSCAQIIPVDHHLDKINEVIKFCESIIEERISKKQFSKPDVEQTIFEIDDAFKIADTDLRLNNSMAKVIGYNYTTLMEWFKNNNFKFIR